MKTTRPRRAALAALVLAVALSAVPALAAIGIDCGGTYSPGQTVPLQILVQNPQPSFVEVDVTVGVITPVGPRVLGSTTVTLPPLVNLNVTQEVTLPAQIPSGGNTIGYRAVAGGLTSTDTCSFDVN